MEEVSTVWVGKPNGLQVTVTITHTHIIHQSKKKERTEPEPTNEPNSVVKLVEHTFSSSFLLNAVSCCLFSFVPAIPLNGGHVLRHGISTVSFQIPILGVMVLTGKWIKCHHLLQLWNLFLCFFICYTLHLSTIARFVSLDFIRADRHYNKRADCTTTSTKLWKIPRAVSSIISARV